MNFAFIPEILALKWSSGFTLLSSYVLALVWVIVA